MATCFVVFSLIYLMDIRKKWQILVEVIFDPFSCLENMNKSRETTLHIPMHHQGPREHQNPAFRSNFLHLEVTMNAWKIMFLGFFFQFFPIPCTKWPQKPVEMNLPIKIPHWGHKEYLFGPIGSGFRSGNGHIQPWNPLKLTGNWFFSHFTAPLWLLRP